MTIAEINNRIKELKHTKDAFTNAKEKLGSKMENYISSFHCDIAIKLINKEIDNLENYNWN